LSKADRDNRNVLETLASFEEDDQGLEIQDQELIEKVKRTMFSYQRQGKLYMSPVVRRGLREK